MYVFSHTLSPQLLEYYIIVSGVFASGKDVDSYTVYICLASMIGAYCGVAQVRSLTRNLKAVSDVGLMWV